ncbi:MAG: Verru_Chthon cassette protein A [Verrucomicrobiae bacterium]
MTAHSLAGSRRGAAMILILAALTLLSLMTLAFLRLSSTEVKSSQLYAKSAELGFLSDSAVDMVMAQISSASDNTSAGGRRFTWISQPGLVRTYNDLGQSGRAYKLYSSSRMVVDGDFDPAAALADEVPSNWSSRPAEFTDLNAPATSGGCLVFPILDPRAADGTDAVEGFAYTDGGGISGINTTAGDLRRCPMPVRWLYITGNGSIGSLDDPAFLSKLATDPAEGRVAFWTDDETSKVNINTASEGNFWDVPVCGGPDELALASNIPVNGEWNRVPGHPATTSLSAVFPSLLASAKDIFQATPAIKWGGSENGSKPMGSPPLFNGASPPLNKYPSGLPITYPSAMTSPPAPLYATVNELVFPKSNRDPNATNPVSAAALRQRSFFLTATSKAPEVNLFNKPRISLWPITWIQPGRWGPDSSNPGEKAVASIENDLTKNPSSWPAERLIAFASSLGVDSSGFPSNKYYFQRQKSMSPTWDYDNIARNRQIYAYLQNLTSQPPPGYSGSFAAKYPADRDQILTEVFDFVRGAINLNTASLTGSTLTHGGNFTSDSYFYSPEYHRDAGASITTGKVSAGAHQVTPMVNSSNDTKGIGRFTTISEVTFVFFATDRALPTETSNGTGNYTNIIGCNGTYSNSTLSATGPRQTTSLQLAVLLEPAVPIPGGIKHELYAVEISGNSSFSITTSNGTQSLGFPSVSSNATAVRYSSDAKPGVIPEWSANDYSSPFPGAGGMFEPFDTTNVTANKTLSREVGNYYTLFGDQVAASPNDTTFHFDGQPFEIKIYAVNPDNRYDDKPGPLVQTIQIDGRLLTGNYSMPMAPAWATLANGTKSPVPLSANATVPLSEKQGTSGTGWGYNSGNGSYYLSNNSTPPYADARSFDFRIKTLLERPSPTLSVLNCLITPYDTVVSLRLDDTAGAQGDLRLLAGRAIVPASWFAPIPSGQLIAMPWGAVENEQKHEQRKGAANLGAENIKTAESKGVGDKNSLMGTTSMGTKGLDSTSTYLGQAGADLPAVSGSPNVAGDWSNGAGWFSDGGVVVKPQDSYAPLHLDPSGNYLRLPYFNIYYETWANTDFFSPMRQICSPVALGTLPTGVKAGTPWQTLLFCPNPLAGAGHKGFASPPDHLLLDLFWMPAVEPYPISEPLATAGKINLNYQIAPFTYITRKTGLHAVLKATKITAIQKQYAASYKSMYAMCTANVHTRFEINVPETLAGFDARFSANTPFRSASEICEMFLVPKQSSPATTGLPTTLAAMPAWWSGRTLPTDPVLTGDNSLEAPYNQIYPRVTTRSNTFQVHYKVQGLKQKPGATASAGSAGWFSVQGEYQGSAVIERYLDASDSRLTDAFLSAMESESIGTSGYQGGGLPPYQWRILLNRQFVP